MDLVRELKEVRFELNLRGYDCEAVDAFLAKLRSDVAAVQQENDAAKETIASLENKVQDGDGSGSSETEGTLRRTLVLAQRLADETEADSKKAAAELIESATVEANDFRAAAEVEATSMREAGESELAQARNEAEMIREDSNMEAAKSRAEARQQASGILEEAERRGAERVVIIEQAAQEAATSMREPIRAEVNELEDVRGRLLTDISELETHLEDQRVRVRTAVEALRVGMSGSIEDLERVADDDELLATQPAPEHSGASGADVAVAPDVEIIDEVDAAVPAAPTVDDVEEAATAAAIPVTGEAIAAEMPEVAVEEELEIEDSVAEHTVAEDTVTEDTVEEAAGQIDNADVLPEPPVVLGEEAVVQEAESIEAPIVEVAAEAEAPAAEVGPNTEPIPVIATAEAEVDESELVDLGEEPSGMFGTEVGEDAAADDSDSSSSDVLILGGAAAGAAGVGAAVVAADEPVEVAESIEPAPEPGLGFVDRFAEAIDALPISHE